MSATKKAVISVDLMGDVTSKVVDTRSEAQKKFEKIKNAHVGEIVDYYSQDQLGGDELVISPAMVTKVDVNGSASLQVFLESHVAPFKKVVKCDHKEPTAGSYSCRH